MAISDYLNKLVELKNKLIAILRSKGVEVSDDEKLNTLVPKVEEVEGEQNVEWVDHLNVNNFIFKDNVKSVVIPDGVLVIGEHTFSEHRALESVIIPSGVVRIGNYAFNECSNLKNIALPDGVGSINPNAFYYCTALKSIIIPNTVTFIGRDAFSMCYYLADIYYTGTQEEWQTINRISGWATNMGSSVTGGTVIHYNYVPE